MGKRSNPQETVTEMIRHGMRREGCNPRQITNALKLWKTLYPQIAKNIEQPALWAAAVELAVARLELEDEGLHSRIARKYGVKLRELRAKCDDIWRQLKIKPFDPRFCSMPQILAEMIMGDEDLDDAELFTAKSKEPKQPKEKHPAPFEAPPQQLDDFVNALLADAESAYEDCDHIADLALDWHEEHGLQSTQKLLTRLVNHFGARIQDDINIDITADALVALGEVLQEEKRFADAVPLFRRAADIHGNYPGALDDLAESHFALGQYVEAIAAWREEIQIESECSHCYHRIADAYEKLVQPAGMIATLEERIRSQPNDILALDRLRIHWISAGKTAQADAYREQILSIRAPASVEDTTVWVQYQLEAGRAGRALAFLQHYEQQLGERIELRLYVLKAVVLLSREQTEEAQDEIRRARAMPNFCEHCWARELEVIARRFGNEVVEKIKRLSSSV